MIVKFFDTDFEVKLCYIDKISYYSLGLSLQIICHTRIYESLVTIPIHKVICSNLCQILHPNISKNNVCNIAASDILSLVISCNL